MTLAARNNGWLFHNFPIDAHILTMLPSTSVNHNHGILVASTRALWPHFLNHIHQNPRFLDSPHPFDDYTTSTIEQEITDTASRHHWDQYQLYFSHLTYSTTDNINVKSFIPFQRFAHHVNFAALYQPSYLCLHQHYGPWIGLRAIITYTSSIPISPSPSTRPTLDFTPQFQSQIHHAIQHALHSDDDAAAAASGEKWKKWLKVRDMLSHSNPEWDQWRYSDQQLRYHYTHDKALLQPHSK